MIAKSWKQPIGPSADEWLRKVRCLPTVEHSSATQKDKLETFEGKQVQKLSASETAWLSSRVLRCLTRLPAVTERSHCSTLRQQLMLSPQSLLTVIDVQWCSWMLQFAFLSGHTHLTCFHQHTSPTPAFPERSPFRSSAHAVIEWFLFYCSFWYLSVCFAECSLPTSAFCKYFLPVCDSCRPSKCFFTLRTFLLCIPSCTALSLSWVVWRCL